jgi:hypothetical protein
MCAHFFKRFRGLWTRCHFQFLGSGIHVKELQLILNSRPLKDCATGLAEGKRLKVYTDESTPLARDPRGDLSALAIEQPMLLHKFSDQSQSLLRSAGWFLLGGR